jgi:hypothetical protein
MTSSQHSQHGRTSMNMSLSEVLTLRSQWEEIVRYRKSYELSHYNGTIDNLYAFIETGAKKNRFRKNFENALIIANKIVSYYEETNLSGIHRTS